jgi:DnaJ-class molecular chaperone
MTVYQTLGVSPSMTTEEIHEHFKTLARKEHPDVGGTWQQFAKLSEAWSLLKTNRSSYDMELKMLGILNCPACEGRGTIWKFRRGIRPCAKCRGSGSV